MKNIFVLIALLVLGVAALVLVPVVTATPMVDPLKLCVASATGPADTVMYDSARNIFALVRGGVTVDVAFFVKGKGLKLGGETVQIIFHSYPGGKVDYGFPRTWKIGEKYGPIVYGQLCQ